MNNANPYYQPEDVQRAAQELAAAEGEVVVAQVAATQAAQAVYAAKAYESRAKLDLERATQRRDTARTYLSGLDPKAAIGGAP